MISLSEAMIAGLKDRCLDWSIGNVQELETPVMVVRDYSPSYDMPSLSIAFDMAGRARCWLSVSEVQQIDGKSPSPHENYRHFVHQEIWYYPYSIRSLGLDIFQDANELYKACWILYRHAILD